MFALSKSSDVCDVLLSRPIVNLNIMNIPNGQTLSNLSTSSNRPTSPGTATATMHAWNGCS